MKNKKVNTRQPPRTHQATTNMGREGRGRGRGRSQAKGRGQRPNTTKNKQEISKTDVATAKFNVGTAKQASEFTKMKKYIINQVKMKYKYGIYIGTALEDGQEFDFSPSKPKPLVIIQVEGNEQEKLDKMGINESAKIEFQMDMAEYNDKVKTYQENKYKVYSLSSRVV